MPRPARVMIYSFIAFILISIASLRYGDKTPAGPKVTALQRLKEQASSAASKVSGRGIGNVKNSTLGVCFLFSLIDPSFSNEQQFQKIFVLSNPDRPDLLDAFVSSTAATGIDVEVVDRVRGDKISSDILPPQSASLGTEQERNAVVGSWRSHLTAVRRAVHGRLSTLLIIEDDTDWDANLKFQLELFAQASQYITFAPRDTGATWSPYGDEWDLLWLGHCGSKIKPEDRRRFMVENDPTVALPKRRVNTFAKTVDTLKESYEDYTRIVFETEAARCSSAYALSYRGARRVLHTLATSKTFGPFDLALSNLCTEDAQFKCLSVFPQLFERYAATNATLSGVHASNIVYSTRLNMLLLLNGSTDHYNRQFPEDPEPSGAIQTRTLGRG